METSIGYSVGLKGDVLLVGSKDVGGNGAVYYFSGKSGYGSDAVMGDAVMGDAVMDDGQWYAHSRSPRAH